LISRRWEKQLRRARDATPKHDDLWANGSYDFFQDLTEVASKSIEDRTSVRIGPGLLGDGFNRLVRGGARSVIILQGAR
jgi:hypothetical protein